MKQDVTVNIGNRAIKNIRHQGWYNVKSYGARGDGSYDDTTAIQNCINAAVNANGPVVYFPAGTYLLTSALIVGNGLRMYGASSSSSILKMNIKASTTYLIEGNNKDNVIIRHLRLQSSSQSNFVSGIYASNSCDSWILEDIYLDHLQFGIHWSASDTSTPCTGWSVKDIGSQHCLNTLLMSALESSSFTNCTLDSESSSTGDHCIYVSRRCKNLTFTNTVLTGGGGYCLQLYSGYGPSYTTNNITFDTISMDGSNSLNYGACFTCSSEFYDITLNNVTMKAKSGAYPIQWYGGTRVSINDFLAIGGGSFIANGGGTATATDCVFGDGTYVGANTWYGSPVSGITLSNYALGLNVMDYGAHADNTSDDSVHIMSCMTAASSADKNVYIPAGTYLFTGGVSAPNSGQEEEARCDSAYWNMRIVGAGVNNTIITCANSKSGDLFYWYRGENIHLSDMTLRAAAPAGVQAIPNGIYFAGMTDSSIKRMRLENFYDGIRLAGVYDSNPCGSNVVVEDIVTRGCTDLSFQVICMENSIFRNLDLENTVNSGSGMAIYDERRNYNNVYENVTCTGGYRSCMQFSNDHTDVSEASHDITVTNLTLNMPTTIHDNYALTFYALNNPVRHYNITITNLVINVVPSNTECIRWSDGHNIVIDGVTVVGGKCLNAGYSDSVLTSCQIKNGTYDGTYINWVYPANTHGDIGGLTVSNITLI